MDTLGDDLDDFNLIDTTAAADHGLLLQCLPEFARALLLFFE